MKYRKYKKKYTTLIGGLHTNQRRRQIMVERRNATEQKDLLNTYREGMLDTPQCGRIVMKIKVSNSQSLRELVGKQLPWDTTFLASFNDDGDIEIHLTDVHDDGRQGPRALVLTPRPIHHQSEFKEHMLIFNISQRKKASFVKTGPERGEFGPCFYKTTTDIDINVDNHNSTLHTPELNKKVKLQIYYIRFPNQYGKSNDGNILQYCNIGTGNNECNDAPSVCDL
jgi:hypothetical protein